MRKGVGAYSPYLQNHVQQHITTDRHRDSIPIGKHFAVPDFRRELE